jgi:peptide/nickel transport system substrate-binding protein
LRNRFQLLFLFAVITLIFTASPACRRASDTFTIALDGNFDTLDFLGAGSVPANAERIRTLMYNALVKKNENFEYVGDAAGDIQSSFDNLMLTFTLRDNIKFHDGKPLTSADAKYTLDSLLKLGSPKAASFFETINGQRSPMITEITAPDAKTLTIRIARPALKNNLLANLVAIPILPENSQIGTGSNNNAPGSTPNPGVYTPPPGTGAYKFVRYDSANNFVELAANDEYWEGAPNIKQLRVRVIADANSLQAELRSGRVQLAPMTVNLSPDTLKSFSNDSNFNVQQFPGANIQYLSFNTQDKPFDNPKVRQAVAYAINREEIINNLLFGQAKLAYSILPETSWAYAPGVKYDFNPEKAKQLLDEAGFKAGANGIRFSQPVKFKIIAGNAATSQYAQVIQNQLKTIGIPVEIETAESGVFFDQLKRGLYQMTTARYVGGNHDPIYFRDLFASSQIGNSNRTRYSNPEFDDLISKAVNETDREKAKLLYAQAQEIVSRDVPLLPLWYPANVIVASKGVGNFKIEPSGDWTFVRNLTFDK